jgi:hypothetical protein
MEELITTYILLFIMITVVLAICSEGEIFNSFLIGLFWPIVTLYLFYMLLIIFVRKIFNMPIDANVTRLRMFLINY